MSNIILDTNIIVSIVRSSNVAGIFRFVNPENRQMYISVVTEAEINSIAIRRNWSIERLKKLRSILERINVIDITQRYVNIMPK